MLGLERSLGSRIVTYADDLVILCRKGKAEEGMTKIESEHSASRFNYCAGSNEHHA